MTTQSIVSRTDSHGTWTEEREIEGPLVDTPELHEVRDYQDGSCLAGYGEWCHKESRLHVPTPGERWLFAGTPYLKVVRDNQGSAAWNRVGAPDRFWVTENNPNMIRARIVTSSRSIGVRLCCVARFYP